MLLALAASRSVLMSVNSQQGAPGKNAALVLSRTVNTTASKGAPACADQGSILLDVGGWTFPGSRMPAAGLMVGVYSP